MLRKQFPYKMSFFLEKLTTHFEIRVKNEMKGTSYNGPLRTKITNIIQ
jgi:hypothetical protein